MSFWHLLPSGQFSAIVGSVILAGGLVVGAQYATRPSAGAPAVAVAPTEQVAPDWKAQLDAIQADAPGLPEAPSPDTVANLLAAAKTSNYTETAARSLLISLTDAGAQGLGSDIPTQEKIIAQAIQQAPAAKPKKIYAAQDVEAAASSKETQHAYGNLVIEVLGKHTDATSEATLYAIAKATDNNDASALSVLPHIQKEYAALVEDLAAVPVPSTLVPLHVQILNSLSLVAATFDDTRLVLSDPLRGLQGLQKYQAGLDETARVFTSIAEGFFKNGILFTKDEPGAAWSVFLST